MTRSPGAAPPLPAVAGRPAPLVAPTRRQTPQERNFWDALGQAGVVYISEVHNDDSHHEYQFDVLKGLKARGINFVIGWEMFDRTQQPLLDRWEQGQLSLDVVLARVRWAESWGKLSGFYEKMLRWSRVQGVSDLALNAPAELSRKLAFDQSLTESERALLPTGFTPLSGGFDHFADQMAQNPHAGAANPAALQNFYRAQVLWDQTMATRIVEYLQGHPEGKIVVLVGRGHVEGGYGVPAYVKERSDVRQLVLYPGESATEANPPRLATGPQHPGSPGTSVRGPLRLPALAASF